MPPNPELIPAIFNMPGGSEWLVILVVALLLFGKRLPEIMRGLGGSVREFKKGMDIDAPESKPVAPPPPAIEGSVSRPDDVPQQKLPDR